MGKDGGGRKDTRRLDIVEWSETRAANDGDIWPKVCGGHVTRSGRASEGE